MQRRRRIVCECGADLGPRVPRNCPQCGAEIVAVRRDAWPLIRALALVAALFGILVLFAWWMARQG